MGEEKRLSSTQGEVRRSWILRQAIHFTLRNSYLAGVEAARRATRPNPEISDEGTVEARSSSGMDGQL